MRREGKQGCYIMSGIADKCQDKGRYTFSGRFWTKVLAPFTSECRQEKPLCGLSWAIVQETEILFYLCGVENTTSLYPMNSATAHKDLPTISITPHVHWRWTNSPYPAFTASWPWRRHKRTNIIFVQGHGMQFDLEPLSVWFPHEAIPRISPRTAIDLWNDRETCVCFEVYPHISHTSCDGQ